MKIGIVTFHRADNYGAVLQCYALEQYLKTLSEDVEIIDYRNARIEKIYKIFNKPNKHIIKWGYKFLKTIIKYKKKKLKKYKFEAFRDKMNLSIPYTKEDILNNKLNYDLIISGSDQVLNKSMVGTYDDVYFLNFNGEHKKATYAASMGSFENGKDQCFLNLVSKIDFLSIRENYSAKFLENQLNRKIYNSLDPVFLMGKDFWLNEIQSIELKTPEKYILFYCLDIDKDIIKILETLQTYKKLPIVTLRESLKFPMKVLNYSYSGPLDFLYLIKNADCIVTSSFHATAFSAIFEKELYCKLHPTTGERTKNLCELFEIENRLYYNFEEFKNKYEHTKNIKYTFNQLENLKIESIEYLKEIIN